MARKSLTGADYAAMLEDPEFQKRQAAVFAEAAERQKGINRDRQELVGQLQAAGYPVDDLKASVLSLADDEQALRIMLGTTSGIVLNGVLHALTDARPNTVLSHALVHTYLDHKFPDKYLWGVGAALFEVATPDVEDDVARLVAWHFLGRSRQMLVLTLGRLASSRKSRQVLVDALGEQELRGHAAGALAAAKVVEALPELVKRARWETVRWVREELAEAVKKLRAIQTAAEL